MNPIFKKLNFKDHEQIIVMGAPDSFISNIEEMSDVTRVKTNLSAIKKIDFIISFVTKQKEVDDLTKKIMPLTEGDAVVWFAYPKGTSKKYKCDFNRDTGWNKLGEHGFEPVRMVAIDEDWSALRFREADHIKKMTRSFAMSAKGKAKVSAQKRGRTSRS